MRKLALLVVALVAVTVAWTQVPVDPSRLQTDGLNPLSMMAGAGASGAGQAYDAH